MNATSPLCDKAVVREIERVASAHFRCRWTSQGFADLRDRASHPAGILRGQPFSLFAKMSLAEDGPGLLAAELDGLELLRRRGRVATPTPVGPGVVELEVGSVLLAEAASERFSHARTEEDWRSIGRALGHLHDVHDERFGLDLFDGYFGPFFQDNRPLGSGSWADFYAERRILPRLESALRSGHLPSEVATAAERLVGRLGSVCGPDPTPSLLHGDAQQNNFMSTDRGVLVIDAAPYFGHPELDLALIDSIDRVPKSVFDAYSEIRPIDPGFAERRELWRVASYLATVEAERGSPFGRRCLRRLIDALRSYR
ncbi:MAG: fructosamine kinase family protein [Acidimicrobiales bacterium]